MQSESNCRLFFPFLHLAFTISVRPGLPLFLSLSSSAGCHPECSAAHPPHTRAPLHCHSRHLRWRALRWHNASSQVTLHFSLFPFSLHNVIFVDIAWTDRRRREPEVERGGRKRYTAEDTFSLGKLCWINSGLVDANRSLLQEDTQQSSSATITIARVAPTLNTWQKLTATVRKHFLYMLW